MQASRGAVNVTIISAEALKKKQVETIQQAVMKFVGDSKSVSWVSDLACTLQRIIINFHFDLYDRLMSSYK